MTVLIAKSSFLIDGDLVEPGDVVPVEDERTGHYIDTGLCEWPVDGVHPNVSSVPDEGKEAGVIVGHGGGWYSVLNLDCTRIDKVQGLEEARHVALSHSSSEPTDS
jgi:hypothetical protein